MAQPHYFAHGAWSAIKAYSKVRVELFPALLNISGYCNKKGVGSHWALIHGHAAISVLASGRLRLPFFMSLPGGMGSVLASSSSTQVHLQAACEHGPLTEKAVLYHHQQELRERVEV